MSAAAVLQPIRPQQPILTGIKNNWTRTRPSILRGLPRWLSSHTADICFGLILDHTVGRNAPWAKIPWSILEKVTGSSRRQCEASIANLLGRGDADPDNPGTYLAGDALIRRRKSKSGSGYEYQIVQRPDIDSETSVRAKCRDCGKVGEVDLDRKFIPVPHSVFESLPKSCDRGMYMIVKAIVERTMRWDQESKQIVVIPCEITIDEFRAATGQEKSEILADLKKLQSTGYGFIGSEPIGRSNLY